jgi:hypothetical protein
MVSALRTPPGAEGAGLCSFSGRARGGITFQSRLRVWGICAAREIDWKPGLWARDRLGPGGPNCTSWLAQRWPADMTKAGTMRKRASLARLTHGVPQSTPTNRVGTLGRGPCPSAWTNAQFWFGSLIPCSPDFLGGPSRAQRISLSPESTTQAPAEQGPALGWQGKKRFCQHFHRGTPTSRFAVTSPLASLLPEPSLVFSHLHSSLASPSRSPTAIFALEAPS